MNLKEFVTTLVQARQDDIVNVEEALRPPISSFPAFTITMTTADQQSSIDYKDVWEFSPMGVKHDRWWYSGNNRSATTTPMIKNLVSNLETRGEINKAGLIREFDFMMANALSYCRKYFTKDEIRFLPRIQLKKVSEGTLWVTFDERTRRYVIAYNPEFILFDLLPAFITSYASSGDIDYSKSVTLMDMVGITEPMDILYATMAFGLKHEMGHLLIQNIKSSRSVDTVKSDIDNHSLANVIEDSYINNQIISAWLREKYNRTIHVNVSIGGITEYVEFEGAPSDLLLAYLQNLVDDAGDQSPDLIVYLQLFDDLIAKNNEYMSLMTKQNGYEEESYQHCKMGTLQAFLAQPGKVTVRIFTNAILSLVERMSYNGQTPSNKRYVRMLKEITATVLNPNKTIAFTMQDLGKEKKRTASRRLGPLQPGMLVRIKSTTQLAGVIEKVEDDPTGLANDTYTFSVVDMAALKGIVDGICANLEKWQVNKMRGLPNIPKSLGLDAWPTTGEIVKEVRRGVNPVALEVILPYYPEIKAPPQGTQGEKPPKIKLSDLLRQQGHTEEEIKEIAERMRKEAEENRNRNIGQGNPGGDGPQPPPPIRIENDLFEDPKDDTERMQGQGDYDPDSNSQDSDDDDDQKKGGGGSGGGGGDKKGGKSEKHDGEVPNKSDDEGQDDGNGDKGDSKNRDGKNSDEGNNDKKTTGGGEGELYVGQIVKLRSTGEKVRITEILDDGRIEVETVVMQFLTDSEDYLLEGTRIVHRSDIQILGGDEGGDEPGDPSGGEGGDEEFDEEGDDDTERSYPGERTDNTGGNRKQDVEDPNSDGVPDGWDGTDHTGGFDLSKLKQDEGEGLEDYDPDDPWLKGDGMTPEQIDAQRQVLDDMASEIKNDPNSVYGNAMQDDLMDITTVEGEEVGGGGGGAMSYLKMVQMVSDKTKLYKLLREKILKATGIKEEYDPSQPSRKVKGLFGKDIEMPTLRSIVILLDISYSMGTPKFRAVISQLKLIAERFRAVMGKATVHLICWDDNDNPPIHFQYAGFSPATLERILSDGNRRRGSTVGEMGWLALPKYCSKPDLILNCTDGEYTWTGQGGAQAVQFKNRNKTIHIIVQDDKESFVNKCRNSLPLQDPMFWKRIILVDVSLAMRHE